MGGKEVRGLAGGTLLAGRPIFLNDEEWEEL